MSIVIGVVIGLLAGAVVAWYVTGKMVNSRAQNILSDAEKDAEVIKKNKLLEAKEEILAMKGEAEKQINSRTSKIQANENRIKQRIRMAVVFLHGCPLSTGNGQEHLRKKPLRVDISAGLAEPLR